MKAGIFALIVGLAVLTAWSVFAPGGRGSDLLISDAVITPLDTGEMALLARITNSGAPDRLIEADIGDVRAQLYDPAQAGRLPVPQGSVALALDGAHVRVPWFASTDGALIPVELTFESAGKLRLKARLSDPKARGDAQEVGLFGLGDICRVGDGEPAPKLSLSVIPEGDGWRVNINADDFTFSEDLVGLYHVPGMGHGHLYVGGMKLGRLYSPTAYIGALPKGRHELRVTLNTNDHRAYVVDDTPVTAEAVIAVD